MDGKKSQPGGDSSAYNVNFTVGKEKERLIRNNHQADNDFYQFLLASFQQIYQSLAGGGAIYVFHADTEGLNFGSVYSQ